MTRWPGSIHQVIDHAFSGDSVTNDALGIQAQLRNSRSQDSEIWALHAPSGPIGVCMRVVSKIPTGSPDDVIIVHTRDPDSPVWTFLAGRRERIVLRVHGWQLPDTRPLKTVAERLSPRGGIVSRLDVLSSLAEALLRADIHPFAILATSPFVAAIAGTGGTDRAVAVADRAVAVAVIPPFFPYDEFAAIGADRQEDPSSAETTSPERPSRLGPSRLGPSRLGPSRLGPSRLRPSRRRAPRPDELHGPRIMCIGRLDTHAEVEQLLIAVHLAATNGLDGALLVVAGRSTNPGYEVALREFARDLRINVFFAGHCSQPNLLDLMASASMMVSPGRSSGFGVRFAEAMAAGVPVIGRAAGGVADTVGRAGLLLDVSDDVEVLAEAVAAIASDRLLRQTLIDLGRARASELAPARSAELLGAFFDATFGE